MSKISGYANSVSALGTDDLLDVSEKISSSPDVYESRKMTGATLATFISSYAANIISTDGLTMTANRTHDLGSYVLTFQNAGFAIEGAQTIKAASAVADMFNLYDSTGSLLSRFNSTYISLWATSQIASEVFGVTGHTILKGVDTAGTSKALDIYDNDTVPTSLWSFRNNGDVYQGKDSIRYLQGNDFTISTLSGSATPINYEFSTSFGGYYSRWDDKGALTIKAGTTSLAFRVLSKVDATQTMFRVGSEGGGFMSTNNARLWTIADSTTSTTKNEFDENRISQYWNSTEYHRIQTSGAGTGVSFFRPGISGSLGYFIVGNSARIGSEDISLQGRTLVQGAGTAGTNIAFEVYDSAGTPASKFEIRSNGDIYTNSNQGLSATYTFGGGSTGDIASMTFTNGLLTAVTTVP